MSKVTITFETAVAALERAVKLKGEDYTYTAPLDGVGLPHCVYFDRDGSPSCIVGYVLVELGMTPFAFSNDLNRGGVCTLRNKEIIDFADVDEHGGSRTQLLLAEAQELQDEAEEWGTVVRHAKAYVDELEPVS